ncbi:MAG: hypothetical protein RQ751_01555 [Longimicrobiales bacterium]|nr:hypothetical protein [Longimicrobiales bacterium]
MTLPRPLLPLLAALWVGAASACRNEPDGLPDRETFIEVWVELRVTALGRDGAVLPEAARDSILATHGVTPEALLRFAEVRGSDPEFMAAVWVEIEDRLTVTPEADSAAAAR